MVTIKEKPSLTIVRRLKAAPEKVWRALTQPEALKQWMAPGAAYRTTVAEIELRVGGRYHIVMQDPDGTEHGISGVYREIVAGRKLVHTWRGSCSDARGPETLVTMELRAVDGGTELTLRHEQFIDQAECDKHQNGWTGCLAQLEKFVG